MYDLMGGHTKRGNGNPVNERDMIRLQPLDYNHIWKCRSGGS